MNGFSVCPTCGFCCTSLSAHICRVLLSSEPMTNKTRTWPWHHHVRWGPLRKTRFLCDCWLSIDKNKSMSSRIGNATSPNKQLIMCPGHLGQEIRWKQVLVWGSCCLKRWFSACSRRGAVPLLSCLKRSSFHHCGTRTEKNLDWHERSQGPLSDVQRQRRSVGFEHALEVGEFFPSLPCRPDPAAAGSQWSGQRRGLVWEHQMGSSILN